MDLFVRLGPFQRVMRKKIKKIDSRLRLCAKRLIRSSPDRFSRPATGTGGAISESLTRAQRPPRAPRIRRRFRSLAFWASTRRKNRQKRRLPFAERNERFRDAGRKSLRSLGVRNGPFRAIVCFQWLDPLFVSHEIATAIPARMKRRAGLADRF